MITAVRFEFVFCACLLAGVVGATQVCTTTTLGNQNINGISGSSDSHVIAVGASGTIAQWDGAAWSSMTSPSGEALFDVEVVDASTAFSVGRNGTALQLIGGIWVQQPTPTSKELHGVWADSASEAWAVGHNGVVLLRNGSVWSDVTVLAQAGGREMEDVWGDALSVYTLDQAGILYRYDRMTGIWDTPDTTCDVGGGLFRDLWGDAAGNLYLVQGNKVYLHDGSSCTVVATASRDLLGIHGGAGRIIAVGKGSRVLDYDGSAWTETDEGVDDFHDVWVSSVGNAYYAGKKGELTACQCSDCVVPGFLLVHDGFGIHCLDEPVRVDVIDIISGNPYPTFDGEITLDTQTGAGTWSLTIGSGVLTDAVANDGLAIYDWPVGETTATFALSYPEGASVFDIDTFDTTDPAIRDDDTEGNMVFSASGFSVTAAPLSNPPPGVINPFAGPVTAGTNFSLYIAVYGQTPTDPQCGVIESYTGVQNLKFWSSYVDPGTGTVPVTIDGSAIATTEAASTPQPVVFANGQASVVAKYKDAGRIQILLKDDSASHPELPSGIGGATAA
ncbi:MAG: hypothetical protein OES99_10295, partial [Gammaproteobacteria bacterium]|nr:hypothetical protein [Gammaproteobacteria bacterium]